MKRILGALFLVVMVFVSFSCSDNVPSEEQNSKITNNVDLKERLYEIDYSLPEMIFKAQISGIIKVELRDLEISNDYIVVYFDKYNNLVFHTIESLNFAKEAPSNPSIKTDNKEAYYKWVEERIEEGWIVTGYYDKKTGYYHGYTQKPK